MAAEAGRPLAGRVALVTGAGRGQGRAEAVALAAAGADVVVCDAVTDIASVPYPLATADDLAATAEAVRATGARCVSVVADVRVPADLDAAVGRAVTDLGRLDLCVANAGICSFSPVAEMSDETWADMIAVDLTGVFNTLRAVLPTMIEQRYGRIVATSSLGGRKGVPNLGHYAAAKWGVIGLVKTVALEVATAGITVNAVCPASVDTPMLHNPAMYGLFAPDRDDPSRDDVVDRYASLNPMRRPWLDADEVARAVVFLCADEHGAMSGETLNLGLATSATMP